MCKLFAGFAAGVLTGYGLERMGPINFFLVAFLVLFGLAVVLFYLFHLGLRDFQD